MESSNDSRGPWLSRTLLISSKARHHLHHSQESTEFSTRPRVKESPRVKEIRTLDSALRSRGPHECVGAIVGNPVETSSPPFSKFNGVLERERERGRRTLRLTASQPVSSLRRRASATVLTSPLPITLTASPTHCLTFAIADHLSFEKGVSFFNALSANLSTVGKSSKDRRRQVTRGKSRAWVCRETAGRRAWHARIRSRDRSLEQLGRPGGRPATQRQYRCVVDSFPVVPNAIWTFGWSFEIQRTVLCPLRYRSKPNTRLAHSQNPTDYSTDAKTRPRSLVRAA